ncbi:MAG: response regulator transcription factor [Saprospiraceae bacterium]|nr:response regulator transcription factor [Saprospiraceae bacterium]MBK8851986.1 response regulator transcription factor [Saprospiraceae bacterium]MBL0082396.1 response regulator transcription factor [Saprospiraceae bacterium]
MDKIKIGIVDDEKLFIKGMQMIINGEADLTVTYQAENGSRFLDDIAAGKADVDIVLLDLSMPIMDGVDVLLKTASMNLPFKIIVLTSHYNDSIILKLLDEGAAGYLAKNEDPATVLTTIRNVAQRGFYINDYILNLIRNRRLLSRKKPIQSELTPREIEVLKLICQEFTNKEIAEKLYISARTVEGHRKSILEKTECKSTAGLVIYAIEHKLISVNVSKFV